MRRVLFLPWILLACGGSKEAKTATLTPADLTGTYEGTTMADGTDSVVASWTAVVVTNAAGGLEGKLVNHAAPTDTVSFTQTISGDSVIAVSAAYTDPAAPMGAPQLKWTSVSHGTGSERTGRVEIMAASSDSLIQRVHWKATRTP